MLTDEVVKRGHEVTLFASGDSITLAKLESVHPQALRLDPTVKECGICEMLQLSRVYEQALEFDIIHSHMGCSALPQSITLYVNQALNLRDASTQKAIASASNREFHLCPRR